MTTLQERTLRDYALADRYTAAEGTVHLTGIQAIVRMVLDGRRRDRAAGLDTRAFVSGYEGSPLGGLDLELGRRRALLDDLGVVFNPGLNEESAATAVQGTQLAAIAGRRHQGVTGFWYGKSPGLDRAADAIRHANLMGTSALGGALAVVGDDPGAKSSSVPGASERLLADLGLPVLFPADPGEVVAMGLHGVALSRVSGLWVGLKVTTVVADGSATVRPADWDFTPIRPELLVNGRPFTHTVNGRLLQPVLGPLERDLVGARTELACRYVSANGLNRITQRGDDDRIGIVAAGPAWWELHQALRGLGLDEDGLRRCGIRLLKLGMISPLEPGIVREFATGLREIVVVEEKRSFVEAALKDLLYGTPGAPAVHGKFGPDGSSLFPAHGQLDADAIAAGLATRLGIDLVRPATRGPIRLALTTTRTPFFCSGCPHGTATVRPENSLVAAGIGCHTMVLLMDADRVGEVTGLTQMGGEGTQWIGMAPFVQARHLVQNLGDGTFHHSGSLAIRAAVAAGVNITYKLLHNGTVAMTGGQDAVGALGVPAITRLLAVEGVRRTIVTTEDLARYRGVRLAAGVEVWHRDRLEEAQRVLAGLPGVTVLIHDQECAAEQRRKRTRGTATTPATRVMINERVCEGCGDCAAKSRCLSVHPVDTEFGLKTRIHQSSCNLDFSCLAGDCPSFLRVTPGEQVRRPAADLSGDALPDPPPSPCPDAAVRIAGIGGTGVVTVAQILATAALLCGREVRGLDQTGLAQKGGTVVSDLRITTGPALAGGRLAARECDLYLGADLLAAAEPAQLAVVDPERTVAVVSTTQVPTGAMLGDPEMRFPAVDGVVRCIADAVRSGTYLDARGLAEQLFGDDQYANMLLVGAAYQRGALPLPATAVEGAIALNGAAVTQNVQAFRRGRQAVADPAALERDLEPTPAEPEPVPVPVLGVHQGSELARLVGIRVRELTAYQDARYAARYVADVERVRAAEVAAVPGSTSLAETVARNLFSLMAYKDEYEVARLSLDPAVRRAVEAQFGRGARAAFLLHPPVLRAMGLDHKIALGRWARPVLVALRGMRRLRGTVFDPFGLAHVRRVERELIAEYRSVLERLAMGLDADNHGSAVEIAALPELIRGYEAVKLASVQRYRAALRERL